MQVRAPMQLRAKVQLHPTVGPAAVAGRRLRALARGAQIGAILLATLAAASQLNSQQPGDPANPVPVGNGDRSPDSKSPPAVEQQPMKPPLEGAAAERKREINDDSAKLLQLASDLKAEVDKTTKDTLSVSVVRKADEIERLAHNVREKMKLTTSAAN